MDKKQLESYQKAGEISIKVKEYAKDLIKPGMPLVEIAQKIEKKIEELGGIPAFPVNLSIDAIAAHYHPTIDDLTKATGLLKVDIGVHINGFIADTAFSLDLTPNKEHKELIRASEHAVENAIKIIDENPTLHEIGESIKDTIESHGFFPIVNLSGHGLDEYDLHSGITIPNYPNNKQETLEEDSAYAIEPFATAGEGKIYEGASSNIYSIIDLKNTRNLTGRKILEYVWDKYQALPFSLREMQEKFGPMSRLAMKQMTQEGILHDFPQLIEKSHKPVSQAEHTIVKLKNKNIVTTK